MPERKESGGVVSSKLESEEPFVQEYLNILADGYQPNLGEYLARIPDEHRAATGQRLREILEPSEPPPADECVQETEVFVREYMNLLTEGWKPDLEEYLERVPESLRDVVREQLAEPAGEGAAVEPFVREYRAFLEQGWKHDLEKYLQRVPENLRDAVREQLAETAEPEPEEDDAPDDGPRIRSLADEIVAQPEELVEQPEVVEEPEPVEEPELVESLEEEPVPEAEGPPEISGYNIEGELGTGMVGTTYVGWDEINKRRVALKVLRAGTPESAPKRMLGEGQRAAGVSVPFDDVADGRTLVRAFVEGNPIDAAALGLPLKERVRLLQALASKLAEAHAADLVHGSLKPGNVLVNEQLEPVLVDFGIAGAAPSRTSLRDLPAEACTFATPERAQGRPPTAASDVFSLGAIMYAALTGQVPFTGATPLEVLKKIAEDDPVFPRTLVAEIPEPVEAICLACLARNPRARPSAADVVADLERFLTGDPVQLRPVRYRDMMRDQVRKHITRVQDWQEHGLVTASERDRLEAIYRRALAREEQWTFDASSITIPQAVLYLGIGLVVAATALLHVFGGPGMAVVPPALAGALLGAGFWARLRRDLATAGAFLTGGVLAAVPGVLSVLDAQGLLEPPLRLVAATGAGFVLSVAGLVFLRAAVFAWTTAALLVGSLMSTLLMLGWADRAPGEKATWLLPLVVLLPIGLAFEKRGRFSWATPFYLVGLLAFVVLPILIAMHGTPFPLPSFLQGLYAAVALHAVVLLGLQIGVERTKSLDLRSGARLLELTAPALLLAALYLNALEVRQWGAVACYIAAVAILVVSAPWRRHRAWLITGLVGLALACHLPVALELVAPATYSVGLAAAGAVAVTGTILYRRFRKKHA